MRKLIISSIILLFFFVSPAYCSPCTTNICQNGGICGNYSGNANCTCTPSFTGLLCQTPVDFCVVDGENPCLHNGVCINGNTSFTCECESGWVGNTCQTQFCDCAENFNCVNTTANALGFVCVPGICAPENDPCENGSNCTVTTPGTDDYTCACETGWIGKNCQFENTFPQLPTSFVLNISIGVVTTPFLNYQPYYNSSDAILQINSDNNSITNFVTGVGALEPPTSLMNQTIISVELNNTAENVAYFMSILIEKSKIIPVDVNGTLRTDWTISTLSDIPASQMIYFPRESIFDDNTLKRLPHCNSDTEKGCDGFAFYPGAMRQLYTQQGFAGVIFDLALMVQTTNPIADDFGEGESDTRSYGLSNDNTKAYSHVQLFSSSSWYDNSTAPTSSSSSLSKGSIAGIVVGVVSACILSMLYFFKCKKKPLIASNSRFRRAPGIALARI